MGLDGECVYREYELTSPRVQANVCVCVCVCVSAWKFTFGFVIPMSVNSWEQTILAAGDNQMIPAEVLSGNTKIETSFFDDDYLVFKNVIRLFYI